VFENTVGPSDFSGTTWIAIVVGSMLRNPELKS